MLVLFALTLLTSAALMFTIEPMFAKMVLPLLGGAPMVWNTCMVFYQAILLAGYVYAHFTIKSWGTHKQAKIHLLGLCTVGLVIALAMAYFVLPVRPGSTFGPRGDANPILWLLPFMLLTIGFPMFVISASAADAPGLVCRLGPQGRQRPLFPLCRQQPGKHGGLDRLSAAGRALLWAWPRRRGGGWADSACSCCSPPAAPCCSGNRGPQFRRWRAPGSGRPA